MTIIKSPSTGDAAEVDKSFKLQARAVTETSNTEAILAGQGFSVTSGDITLTTANESAMLFFQNDSDNDLVFIEARTNAGPTTGGTETFITPRFYFAATAMTSGSSTDAQVGNLRFGSSLTVESTSEIGVEGAGITGVVAPDTYQDVETSVSNDFFFVLPKGQGFGASIEPPAGNTSIKVAVTFLFYVDNAKK